MPYFLDTSEDLKEVCNVGDVIYGWLWLKKVYRKDTMSHLASGQTGWVLVFVDL